MEREPSTAKGPQLDAEELLAAQQGSPPENPPVGIPRTSDERLRAAVCDQEIDVDSLVDGTDKTAAAAAVQSSGKTILYLAYGSNLSAQTFRKYRGIVPISKVNVCVPDLVLTFDLPGIPYVEYVRAVPRHPSR
jgi:hypothetical protein